jgi:hypothetical protein
MTRTRPGSIIRECHDAQVRFYTAFVGLVIHTVASATRHCATTTHGYKIRSWIVVKE